MAERRETVIMKEGNLSKKGGFVHSWKKRWFKCSMAPPSFSYYTKKGGELIKKVNIEPGSRVGVVPAHHNYSFGFAIAMKSRTWVFDAESEKEREEWLAAVHMIIAAADKAAGVQSPLSAGRAGETPKGSAAKDSVQYHGPKGAAASPASASTSSSTAPATPASPSAAAPAEKTSSLMAPAAAAAGPSLEKKSSASAQLPPVKKKADLGSLKVLVFGATGLVGNHVVTYLLEEHQTVVAAVRAKDKGAALAKRGAELAVCDTADEASLVAAMKNVDRIFLLSPFAEDIFTGEQAILSAIKKVETVQFVCRLSVMGADERSPMLPAQKHGKCDAALKAVGSGVEWCIVAPTFFFQNLVNFHPEIKANSVFTGAAGNAKYSLVDARDVAKAAAWVLVDPVFHFKKTYDLATNLFADSEIATKLSSVVRKKITYKALEEQAFLDMLTPYAPAWQVAMMKDLEAIKRNGWAGSTSADFEKLTGQKPRGLDAFVGENAHNFSSRVHGVGESVVVLVTGATGRLGRAAVGCLAARYPHAEIRAGCRDVHKGLKFFRGYTNVTVVACDTEHKDSLAPAFAGADSVLIIPPPTKRIEDVYAYASAAKKAQSIRLLALVAHICAGDNTLLGRHWGTLCDVLVKTGIATCFLYTNMFNELLFKQVAEMKATGRLVSPAHSHDRITQIATDDIGSCVASVLVEPDKYANNKYTLTGPEALSFAELAALYSRLCGTRIEYQRVTKDEFGALLEKHYDRWQVDALVELWEDVTDGKSGEVSNEVERLTGRCAATAEELVAVHVAPLFGQRTPVLVLGATGAIGAHVVRALSMHAGNAWTIRAGSRNPDSEASKALAALPNVTVVRVDVADAHSITTACQGVTRVYYQSFGGNPDTEKEGKTVADLLAQSGVKYVVKLSSLNIAKDHTFGEQHRNVEHYLRSKGLKVVSLQPSCFFSGLAANFGETVRRNGVMYLPVQPATKYNWIDNRDVGEVAALCLIQPGHAGKAYQLTGPDQLSMNSLAELFAEITGKPVSHMNPGAEGFATTLAGFGLNDEFIRAVINLYQFMDRGGYDVTSDDVERVTGHKPRSVRTWLAENRAVFVEAKPTARDAILVLGATGHVGQCLVAALSRASSSGSAFITVLAATRTPADSAVAKNLGRLPNVQVVALDYTDEKALTDVLTTHKVTKVWLQSEQGAPDPAPAAKAVVDVLQKCGVQLVVKLSAFNLREDYAMGVQHREVEEYIRAKKGALRLVSIQPSCFFSNALTAADSIKTKGEFYDVLPDDAKVNWVDNRDIAEVAAAALIEPGHAGRTYSPAGQVLTPAQIAAIYTQLLGRPVKHVQITFDMFREILSKQNAPAKMVDNMADLYQFFLKGGYDNVTDDIASLTYHRPRALHQFIREHSYAFSDKLRVGILGSGEVGQTLGSGLLKWGYRVVLGSRDPSKAEVVGWLQSHFVPHAAVGSFADAAKFADIVIIATRDGGDTEGSLITAGLDNLKGKIVWDTINPLNFAADGSASLKLGFNVSHGESVQKWSPGAKVVKVFNAIGAGDMVNPVFEDGDPTMFIAGDDKEAKATTTAVLSDLGWKASHIIDAGGISESRLLEPMAVLWLRYSLQHQFTSHHAFSLLMK